MLYLSSPDRTVRESYYLKPLEYLTTSRDKEAWGGTQPSLQTRSFSQVCPRFFMPLLFCTCCSGLKEFFSLLDSLPYQHKVTFCVMFPQLHSSWLPFIHVCKYALNIFYIYFLNYQN